ncbi:hypothetical protein HNF35_004202 [Salmonella enterica]|nr:hypothetical protein [Salmonella enterica subsp. enterica serovar Alachua]EFO7033587.1 hypothetical protein [Salmonella enterica]EFT7377628.1 hypothetical protein [Salmonella enterica]EGB3088440.1 hypothetical protein [Salmonella enterica]
MERKNSSPFSQENGHCAYNCNFMIVGEVGQGKTALGVNILRGVQSNAIGECATTGRTGNRIKGNRNGQ